MLLTLVPNPLWRTVSRANADRGKAGLQLAFCSGSPAQGSPLDVGQHAFGRYRYTVWHMPLPRTSPCRNGPNQLHADRIDFEVTRDADRPGEITSRKLLAEGRARSVSGIRQHAAEAHASLCVPKIRFCNIGGEGRRELGVP